MVLGLGKECFMYNYVYLKGFYVYTLYITLEIQSEEKSYF